MRHAAGGTGRRSRRSRPPTARAAPPASRGAAGPGRRLGVPTPKIAQLLGNGAPADAELVAPAGGVVERDRLASEHCRMPERVAQHECPDAKAFGVRGEPGARHHRLVHRLVGGQRRDEVVHAGDAGEAGHLGSPRPSDEVVERQAHLREEQDELHRHCLTAGHGCRSLAPESVTRTVSRRDPVVVASYLGTDNVAVRRSGDGASRLA